MKRKYLIILIVLVAFSVGCNNKETSLLKDGQRCLENHEYYDAQKYLSDFLELEPKNENARAMYMQAIKMPKAEYYKEKGFYNKGIECLENIVNTENGSQKIKVESKELKKELEKLQSDQQEAQNIRKENAKEVAKEAVQKSEQEFYIWQKNQDQNHNTDQKNQNNNENSSDKTILDDIKDTINDLGGLLFN